MDFTCHVGMSGSDDNLVSACFIDYRRLLSFVGLALVFSFFSSFPSGLCIFRIISGGCIPYRRSLWDFGTGVEVFLFDVR